MKEIIIKLENGIWLINDKKYKDLVGIEKLFFEEFLRSIRDPKDKEPFSTAQQNRLDELTDKYLERNQ